MIDFWKETFVSQTNGFDPVTFPHSPMSSSESSATQPMSDTVWLRKGVNKIENNFILTGEQHISISPISRLPIFWCGSSGVGMVPRRPWGLGLKYITLFPLLYLDLGEYWVRKSNLLYVYHVSLEKYFGLYFQKSLYIISYSAKLK